MIAKKSIGAAGLPRLHYLYAVFDEDDNCRRAVQELISQGIESERLEGCDADLLEHPARHAGFLARLERLIKEVGGEEHMAKIYAHHLQQDRHVLAIRIADAAMAEHVTQVITAHGGYEVTYFRDWGIEYRSPRENAAHGLPIHSETNMDE